MTRRTRKKKQKQDLDSFSANPTTHKPVPANGRGSVGVLMGVVACFVLSGFAALLYQTAWLRQFSLVFGTSELAVATTLAAYMGGLAIGAVVAGRVVERVRRPILVYGALEAGIALTALAVPVLLAGASALYGWMLGDQPSPPHAATIGQPVFYLIVAFLVLALPTGFMGATLPMLIRHVVQRNEEVGSKVALLYATNTAGAVAGTVVAGFILLPTLGLKGTVWVGVLVNAVVFVIAAWLAKRAPAVKIPGSDEPTPALTGFIENCITPLIKPHGQSKAERLRAVFREQPAWILPLILISGANAFFYEVLWTRMLAHVLGGSIYAFAIMLAAFLTGIALGGGLAGRVATNRSRAAYGFALTQVAIAALSMAVYAWMGPLIPEQRGMAQLAVYGVMIMLPATIFIGATFPLAVRLLARDEREASTSTARIYAWNTTGAILGAILAGFYLIPTLGFEGSIKLAVMINLIMALWTIAFVIPPKLIYASAAASILLLVGLIYQPGRPQAVISNTAFGVALGTNIEEIYFAVGKSSTVLLNESAGSFDLRTNGLPEASILVRGAPPLRHSQQWLTALPVVARPDTESMLVIGFGGGVALEGVPASVQEVDVIELEPEVVNANRRLAGRRSKDPLEDPRINVIFNDARNALQLTSKNYDVIVSQPSHPWTAGASHLFTREFVHLAKEHLTEGGVFVQWMNARLVDKDLLRSLAATVLDAFEYARIYQTDPTVLLIVGSSAPLDLELELDRTGQPLRQDLLHYSYIGLNGINDFIAALSLDENGFRKFAQGAPLSTDDNNLMATRSRSLADGLDERQLFVLFEPYDPLLNPDSWVYRELGRKLNFSYITSRLLAEGRTTRVGQLAIMVPTPSDQALISALAFAHNGETEKTLGALRAAIRIDPRKMDARFAFIRHRLSDFARGEVDQETQAIASGLTGSAAAVIKGWPLGAAQNWNALVELERELARSNVSDLWYPETVQLRAEWRTKVAGDDKYSFDALRMLDRALVIRPSLNLYVLRAAAASALNDGEALVESGRYVAAYISDKLRRANTGKYSMSDDELNAMIIRLGAFEIRLRELGGENGTRARDVTETITETMEQAQAIANTRGLNLPSA